MDIKTQLEKQKAIAKTMAELPVQLRTTHYINYMTELNWRIKNLEKHYELQAKRKKSTLTAPKVFL